MSRAVLIIGSGPAGLALACELQRRGLPVRLVGPAPTQAPAILYPRALETAAELDVLEALLERGERITSIVDRDGERISLDELDTPWPFALCLPRGALTDALAARFAAMGGSVEVDARLASIEQRDDAVRVGIAADGGSSDELSDFGYVVGCDGERSAVRRAAGVALNAGDRGVIYGVAELTLRTAPERGALRLFRVTEGTAALAPLPNGRWRLVAALPGLEAPPALDGALIGRILSTRCNAGPPASIEQTWSLRVRRRAPDRWRTGRLLVAGAAACPMPPELGLGPDQALADAVNLGWKLAQALDGAGDLLASYEAERAPLATAAAALGDAPGLPEATRPTLKALALQRLSVRRQVQRPFVPEGIGGELLGEHRSALRDLTLDYDPARESPSVREWLDFDVGPRAGELAPDAALWSGPDGASWSLHALIQGPWHTLLLFDGASPTPEGYQNLETIGRAVRERYGRWVAVHVVVPWDAVPDALSWDGSVVLDLNRALHRRYGAGAESLYAIRPDGYIGFRSQRADASALYAWLARVFPGVPPLADERAAQP